MNNDLKKKLRGYSILAASALLPALADGQIIYTDISPDTTTEYFQNLDLINDGLIDFQFRSHISYNTWTHTSHSYTYTSISSSFISAFFQNKVGNSFIDFNYRPAALNLNDTIGPSQPFVNHNEPFHSIYSSFYSSSASNPWNQPAEKYLGLKIVKGSNTYYGWARLFHSDHIYDYAFNATPNQPILAGQKGCINPPIVVSPVQVRDTLHAAGGNIQWYKNGTAVAGATSALYPLTAEGAYAYTLTDSSGCTSMSPAYMFIPCQLVQPEISTFHSLVLCYGEKIYFWLDSLPSYYNFELYQGGKKAAGTNYIEYTPSFTPSYVYYVCRSVNSDCIIHSDSLFITVCSTSAEEVSPDNDQVLIFTNFHGAEIHFTSTEYEGGSLVVLNELGQEVFAKTIHGNITLDNQQFTAGIYFAVIRKEEKQVVKKLLLGK